MGGIPQTLAVNEGIVAPPRWRSHARHRGHTRSTVFRLSAQHTRLGGFNFNIIYHKMHFLLILGPVRDMEFGPA
jgi:hypothetical protein